MEVDAMCEMYDHKENIEWNTYNSKTYKAIIDNAPYGDTEIIKKELDTRPRENCKKNIREVNRQINKQAHHYDFAIIWNSDSVEKMKTAIMAFSIWFQSSSSSMTDVH